MVVDYEQVVIGVQLLGEVCWNGFYCGGDVDCVEMVFGFLCQGIGGFNMDVVVQIGGIQVCMGGGGQVWFDFQVQYFVGQFIYVGVQVVVVGVDFQYFIVWLQIQGLQGMVFDDWFYYFLFEIQWQFDVGIGQGFV